MAYLFLLLSIILARVIISIFELDILVKFFEYIHSGLLHSPSRPSVNSLPFRITLSHLNNPLVFFLFISEYPNNSLLPPPPQPKRRGYPPQFNPYCPGFPWTYDGHQNIPEHWAKGGTPHSQKREVPLPPGRFFRSVTPPPPCLGT